MKRQTIVAIIIFTVAEFAQLNGQGTFTKVTIYLLLKS